jgi:hemoglobin
MTEPLSSTIHLMVWSLYVRVIQDSQLAPYFKDVPISRLIGHQVLMFEAIMTAGSELPDFDIPEVHSRLKVKNSHFTLLLDHVKDVLRDYNISEEHSTRLLTALESLRGDVVTVID